MTTPTTLVAVEEYLRTSYSDGDREYVDGQIVERNLGEKDHSRTQRELIVFFASLEDTKKTYCYPEQRVQVKATRFRIPDVCVYVGAEPDEQVFKTPPFLAIEILSKDDRASDLEEKVDDYLDFGVEYVWVIDPRRERGSVHTRVGSITPQDGILRTENPSIEMELDRLFK